MSMEKPPSPKPPKQVVLMANIKGKEMKSFIGPFRNDLEARRYASRFLKNYEWTWISIHSPNLFRRQEKTLAKRFDSS